MFDFRRLHPSEAETLRMADRLKASETHRSRRDGTYAPAPTRRDQRR